MESSKSKWQVRAWMETSHIVHMNSLLQPRHQRRIRETPFKWFLDIVNPIELNMKLLKQMVRRWVPQHHSFRVRQQLVPFDVVDIVMTLGLGVGGLVVPFDESIVGKVGELFNSSKTKIKDFINIFDNIVVNDDLDVDVVCRLYILVCFVEFIFARNSRHVSNMPCLVLDDLDSLCTYDWSGAIHKYLLDSLNRCNRKILSGNIADSISISGSAVVLQLWAYERLGLHYNSSAKVFPRIRRFRSLNYETKAIDLLFRKGEVHFDWYLRSNDRENPIVRAAFGMDGVGKSEGAPAKGDDSFQCARAARLEKIRINNQKIRSLKDEIVAIRKEVSDRRKRRKVEQCHYVPEAGVAVEGEGNVEAADAAPIEETADAASIEETADAAYVEEAADAASVEEAAVSLLSLLVQCFSP